MTQKVEAKHLANIRKATPKVPVIGVFATSDPRIDPASRTRCQNIAKMAADTISGSVVLPDKTRRTTTSAQTQQPLTGEWMPE